MRTIKFKCKKCKEGSLKLPLLLSAQSQLECLSCREPVLIDLWDKKEREQFFLAAERGCFVKKEGKILHVCPNCGHGF